MNEISLRNDLLFNVMILCKHILCFTVTADAYIMQQFLWLIAHC